MSWLSRLIDGPPDTPPPPSKREQRDIVAAHRHEPGFRNMSKADVKAWARSRHKNYTDVQDGNQFGGRDVITPSDHHSFERVYHYDGGGNYVGASERGKTSWF